VAEDIQWLLDEVLARVILTEFDPFPDLINFIPNYGGRSVCFLVLTLFVILSNYGLAPRGVWDERKIQSILRGKAAGFMLGGQGVFVVKSEGMVGGVFLLNQEHR